MKALLNRLVTFLVLAVLLGLTTSAASAAPAEEINRAATASGAASAGAATERQFIKAFSAVIARVAEAKVPQYVTSAIQLRPDLAPQITAAALGAHRLGFKDDDCNWVDPIIRAAIAAAPSAKDAIVRAALQADPYARECIIAAAGATGTQTAFFRPPGVDAGNINSTALGTINPGNFSGQNNVNSGDQQRITICHNGTTTLTLPRPAADAHLRNHPRDYIGACR